MIDASTNKSTTSKPCRFRRKTMIALEEIDHTWDEDEVREFRKMWRKNIPVVEMVEYFERPIVELAVLIMDQELKGNIIPRAMGL